MTYCLGIRTAAGLVMAADSRTNAGVDHVASFPKMRVWEVPGERVLVLLSAGNLAVTQAVVALLEDSRRREGGEGDRRHGMLACPGVTAAARLVGDALRAVHAQDAEALSQTGAEFTASFLLGGQVRGGPPRLFQIYAAGNYIEAVEETPFLQIGETKYGKPILDRVITAETSLAQAVKCALVSVDSTMRSNLSVGPPIDVCVVPADACRVAARRRYGEDDPYWVGLRRAWGDGVKRLFDELQDPELG